MDSHYPSAEPPKQSIDTYPVAGPGTIGMVE